MTPVPEGKRWPPGFRLASYEIVAFVGAGGMGEVYRARDTKLKRDVALKVLPDAYARDPGRMARFQREAEVLASLNHPNIAHIYGVEERALVMELVEGASPKGPMPFDEAWEIATQIADALEYAHENGVIHRDLKPANVKVTPNGVVKLLDFGLAKAFTAQEQETQAEARAADSPTLTIGATVAGVILGTAAYMAPEQAKGKKVDKRADIWSWGVVLYELLTGERMFNGEDVTDTLAQVLTKEPDLEKVPAQTRKLLRRCLEKEPRQRLRDIGDVRYLLEEKTAPSPSRLALGGWLAAVMLAVMAAAAAWFMRSPVPGPERSYRLAVPPPEGTSFDFAAASGTHALSPDGRTLAFVAESNGATQIWLRPLNGTVARRLDGTDQAYGVSWSPDGRFLAFPIPGKLRRIEVATGTVRDLCPAFDVRGVTWNQQGVIIFAQVGSNLSRVSAEGGGPETVVYRDAARGEEQLYWPQFLPDDRHFLYQMRNAKVALVGTYVASLDTKPEAQGRVRVLNTIQNALYSPSLSGREGFLLYLRGRTLLAQHFDPRRIRLDGEPFAVAEDVGSEPARLYANVALSPSGVLTYSVEDWDRFRVELVGRDGTTIRALGDSEQYVMLELSHGEKQLALSRFESSEGTYDIWLMDLTKGVPSRFTSDPATDQYPVWSPDDREIIFSSSRFGFNNLFRKKLAEGQEERVRAAEHNELARDWSPDGKLLVYEERAANANHLWALPLQSGNPIQLTNTQFEERHPAVSPSGRWLTYVSNESGSYDVYVQAFPRAGRKKRLTTGGGLYPRWRADEKELFYNTPDNVLMALPVQSQGAEFSWGAPNRLFPLKSAPFAFANPFWRPLHDGQSFVVLRPAEPVQGKPITILTNWQAGLKK
jgi:dipeptidyl aminopeptidase/acylaminoacyl peptidase